MNAICATKYWLRSTQHKIYCKINISNPLYVVLIFNMHSGNNSAMKYYMAHEKSYYVKGYIATAIAIAPNSPVECGSAMQPQTSSLSHVGAALLSDAHAFVATSK